jgi:hypothetical protein
VAETCGEGSYKPPIFRRGLLTYTQSLADAVASYRCTFHSSMEGDVTTSDTGSGY